MSVYRDVLQARFGGVIHRGKHNPDGIACALEVASIVRGKEWSDDPKPLQYVRCTRFRV